MITDKNKSFVIKYGPSSIHDDHIDNGIHQEHFDVQSYINGRYKFGQRISQEK